MTRFKQVIKGAAIAIVLAGTATGTTGTASAHDPNVNDYNGQSGSYNNDPNRGGYDNRYDNGRNGYNGHDNRGFTQGRGRGNSVLSILFGNIAYGYRDGYWDHRHAWHSWNNGDDSRRYRNQNGQNFRDYDHTRDPNQGWRGR